jgi:APA family basic amino acid/polyamine antiporter
VPKTMILRVGSPEMVFLVWIAGGVLSLFGALSYAELAAAMPETISVTGCSTCRRVFISMK